MALTAIMIDNSDCDLELHKRFLTKEGFLFVGFNHFPDLLKYLEIQKPDLILIDLQMPNPFDGFSVVEKLNELKIDSIKVFLSGVIADDIVLKFAEMNGVKGVFLKDGNYAGLARNLRELLK